MSVCMPVFLSVCPLAEGNANSTVCICSVQKVITKYKPTMCVHVGCPWVGLSLGCPVTFLTVLHRVL